MTVNKGKYIFCIQLVLFLFLYLFFPSNNCSIDSWGFAAYIKQGEQLFLPHHLFYNVLGLGWVKVFSTLGEFDTLNLLKILNATFASLCLLLLGQILRLLKIEWKNVILWVLFVGSSWGLMRYATENETYIIPIFFSLSGSYFYIKFEQSKKGQHIFYSGVFFAAACLFHQVMFFWWLAILTGVFVKRNFKSILWFALPALIVPTSYVLVTVYYYKLPLTTYSLFNFVFRDFQSGGASINISFSGLILTIINFFRNFVQVHGYISNLFSSNLIYFIPAIILILSIVWGSILAFRIKWDWNSVKYPLVWVYILAVIFQILFAFLSSGNAEFMVMIPFLTAIVLAQILKDNSRFVGVIAVGILTWNISFGLVPLHYFELDNNKSISARVIEGHKKNEKQLFILFNKPRVENEVKYFIGNYPSSVISGIKFDTPNQLKFKIDDALSNGEEVFTDCFDRPKTLSRENLTIKLNFQTLMNGYTLTIKDSTISLSGTYYLYRVGK